MEQVIEATGLRVVIYPNGYLVGAADFVRDCDEPILIVAGGHRVRLPGCHQQAPATPINEQGFACRDRGELMSSSRDRFCNDRRNATGMSLT